jgi:hypothetical protein
MSRGKIAWPAAVPPGLFRGIWTPLFAEAEYVKTAAKGLPAPGSNSAST